VDEHTNGAIKIEVFNNQALGSERTTLEQTQAGDIHFNRLGASFLSSINPQMGALSMPFLFRDRDHKLRVLDGPIGDEFLEALRPQNLLGLSWMDAGFREFYNARREVRVPADLVGLKIRVQESPLMIEIYRLLGASPTPMGAGETYSGIQNGVVDGGDNNFPSFIVWAHHEVAKFYTATNQVASPEMILINLDLWNSFTDAEKRIVKAGAIEGARVEREEWLKLERDSLVRARAAGVTIYTPTAAERQLYVNALMPIYQQPQYVQYADLFRRIMETQ
jgi:tripartite ATP-independent transporter DctP family solute receptor